MNNTPKYFTIIVPIHNEEKNIHKLFKEINKICSKFVYRILFVDDGSRDNSLKIIKELSTKYKFVQYISLSKNFGQQQAIFAGIMNAKGKFIITMDADLQHPPKYIPQMISKYEEGFDIVQTIKSGYENISLIQRILKKIFYFIFNKISSINLPEHSSDFRLISNRAKISIMNFKEKEKFMRGIVQYVGFNYCEIQYDVGKRTEGQAVSLSKLYKLAMSGIYSFSNILLLLPLFFGIFLFITTIVYCIINLNSFNIMNVFNYILFSLIFIFLGVLGSYINKLFDQIRNRPEYIIKESKKID